MKWSVTVTRMTTFSRGTHRVYGLPVTTEPSASMPSPLVSLWTGRPTFLKAARARPAQCSRRPVASPEALREVAAAP